MPPELRFLEADDVGVEGIEEFEEGIELGNSLLKAIDVKLKTSSDDESSTASSSWGHNIRLLRLIKEMDLDM